MNDLKTSIIEKIVEPNDNKKLCPTKAIVTYFDNFTNRATIKFQEPKGEGIFELEKVPVQMGAIGLHSVALKEGTEVWVTFMNYSPFLAKIVGIADEQYESNSREDLNHLEEGALIPNLNHIEECTQTSIYNDVVDRENNDIIKYNEYQKFNLEDAISDFLSELGYYKENEIGITNPNNHSTIKINDDGSIDIFTEDNIGIKIDQKNSKISINASNLEINYKTLKVNGIERQGI